MKNILIKMIKMYQKIPGNFHYSCRYTPSCSNYALEAIEEYGSLKGSFMAFKRICRCNPFGSSGYDPVKKRSVENEKNN